MDEKQHFRWDLQGLRAISVLIVLFFHLDERLVPAGFFGVDIFFVISGFVITRLLLREIQSTDRVDVVRFYARRAKRLLPNASLVLVACLLFGLAILPEFHVRTLADDVIAAALYISNFRFASIRVDYFSSNSAPSAVVHYWSLSIEEQFYIVWPVVMLGLTTVLARSGRIHGFAIFLVVLISASLGFCLVAVQANQPLAFFNSAARIWELACGALVAVHSGLLTRLLMQVRELAGVAGLAMIALAALTMSETVAHPGPLTLVPVCGTVLLIASGLGHENAGLTSVGRLLATRPMVWIGDRSYSLYLWHWPVIVFVKATLGTGPLAMLLAAVLAVVLAWLAYTYVETPLRHRDWRGASLRQLGLAGGLVASVCVAALAAPLASAMVTPHDKAQWIERLRVASNDDGAVYRDKCHRDQEVDQPECLYGAQSADKTVVVIGDSHTAHWFPAFNKASRAEGWRLHSWSKSSCPSAMMRLWNPYKKAEATACHQWRDGIMAKLRAAPRPYLVVLSNSNGYGGWTLSADGKSVITGRASEDEFERGIRESVRLLQDMGHIVAIMRDTPLADPRYKECMAEHGNDPKCARTRQRANNQNNVEARVAGDFKGVHLIDVTDRLCGPEICPLVINGMIVYRDDSHMTATFNETLSDRIVELLRSVKLPATFASR